MVNEAQQREARLHTKAFARVLEHFPMTRKRPAHLISRETGTFLDWNKAIEIDSADDAATRVEKGHR
jgi:hypothetical protein